MLALGEVAAQVEKHDQARNGSPTTVTMTMVSALF